MAATVIASSKETTLNVTCLIIAKCIQIPDLSQMDSKDSSFLLHLGGL